MLFPHVSSNKAYHVNLYQQKISTGDPEDV